MKSDTASNATKIYDLIGKTEGLITSITIQKKNKFRYSIFLNEHFLVGISEATLVEFKLTKGQRITQSNLDKIIDFESYQEVRDYLLRLLSRRDHTSLELLQKGIKKGHSKHVIQKCLIDLEAKGYINKHSFAKKYAHDKSIFNKWGPQKIRAELLKKGLNTRDISQALDEVDSKVQLNQMNILFEKSIPKFLRAEPSKRRKKIFNFFIQKGYSSELILKSIDYYLTQLVS